ncbi:MAG: MOSC domain-containing protein [Geminicoccales bacterium]
MAHIDRIYRYPVKGLSAEPLSAVAVAAGQGLPLDRKFALARQETAFDPAHPVWLAKRHFLMLMREERLAELDVAYDDAGGRLRIARAGRQVLDAETGASAGRETIERFFEAFMALAGRPRLVSAPGHMFTDSATKYVSLINLATVRAVEEAIRREQALDGPLDPLRFRANLYVDGLDPGAELDWVGQELVAGEVRLQCAERIDRCAATNVDPATARRDLNIPLTLRKAYGHIDCGVLLRVVRGGRLETGQPIAPSR